MYIIIKIVLSNYYFIYLKGEINMGTVKFEFSGTIQVSGIVEIDSNDIGNIDDITQEDMESFIFRDNTFPNRIISNLFNEGVKVEDFYPDELHWDAKSQTYRFIIEETQSQEFEVEGRDEEEAKASLISMYEHGDAILDNPALLDRKIALVDEDGNAEFFEEF